MSYPEVPVLLVDDETDALRSMRNVLTIAGVTNVEVCSESRDVPGLVSQKEYSAITLDLSMPGLSGNELLDVIVAERPEIPVVIVTAANDLETAVDCMKSGAVDYWVKPVDKTRLVTGLRRAIETWEARTETDRLRNSLRNTDLESPAAFSHIITNSRTLHHMFLYIESIARTSLPVLITGETGTGKELFAEAVHRASGRSGELVAVNVAGLDDSLFSDTLFGHVKGAYTGAGDERGGMIRAAGSGTLFLDEIGDLPMTSQVKLLRLLQEHEYIPLGSDRPVSTNARFVMATNRDLKEAMKDGDFRSDLFFRLNHHTVSIPPLRERKEDIPLLADHFLKRAYAEINRERPPMSPGFYEELSRLDFSGNVRELQGMMFDLAVRNTSPVLTFQPISGTIADGVPSSANPYASLVDLPTVDGAVELLIDEALTRARGNQSEAARTLGIDRSTLNRRIRKRDDEENDDQS